MSWNITNSGSDGTISDLDSTNDSRLQIGVPLACIFLITVQVSND